MDALELLDLIQKGESSEVQFKIRVNDAYKTGTEMVAFSNTKGGEEGNAKITPFVSVIIHHVLGPSFPIITTSILSTIASPTQTDIVVSPFGKLSIPPSSSVLLTVIALDKCKQPIKLFAFDPISSPDTEPLDERFQIRQMP